jgi:hypothetical protein
METHLEQWLERKQALPAPSLVGISGTVAFETGPDARYLLKVHDGRVELTAGRGDAQAVVTCDSKEEIEHLLRGEDNPVVDALQGHLSLQGDRMLAVKVALGLTAGSPFSEPGAAAKEAPL